MDPETLRAAWKATPFRPFEVHLSDGRSVEILHPDRLTAPPGKRTAIAVGSDDGFVWIDLPLVTSIEFREPPNPLGV